LKSNQGNQVINTVAALVMIWLCCAPALWVAMLCTGFCWNLPQLAGLDIYGPFA